MDLRDKVTVITGGAGGIGSALCHAFAAQGARVVVADLDGDRARDLARKIGGLSFKVNLADPGEVNTLIEQIQSAYGPVDVLVNNAGVMRGRSLSLLEGGPFAPDQDFQESWEINVIAQIRTLRMILPQMIGRGRGYIVNMASAAGLLSEFGSLAYTITKHAAVGLSEWLAITYGPKGIGVSCVCPQGVETPMVTQIQDGFGAEHLREGMIQADEVARAVVQGVQDETFLILPHQEVQGFMERKAADTDRWLAGMQRYRESLYGVPQ
jgi:NAD(P)-dependent dehydrogenase (short-subunit alcohol dehydrogenase family)